MRPAIRLTTNLMISKVFLNANSKKNKQVILSSLFLIYYVVYAISPLSYTFSVKKIVDRIGAAKGITASLNNLNILLLETICAKIDPKKETDHANSTARVLIRKTRAILPENINSRVAPLGTHTLFEDVCSLSDNSVSGRLVYSRQQKSGWQFNALHSGLSPPLA